MWKSVAQYQSNVESPHRSLELKTRFDVIKINNKTNEISKMLEFEIFKYVKISCIETTIAQKANGNTI